MKLNNKIDEFSGNLEYKQRESVLAEDSGLPDSDKRAKFVEFGRAQHFSKNMTLPVHIGLDASASGAIGTKDELMSCTHSNLRVSSLRVSIEQVLAELNEFVSKLTVKIKDNNARIQSAHNELIDSISAEKGNATRIERLKMELEHRRNRGKRYETLLSMMGQKLVKVKYGIDKLRSHRNTTAYAESRPLNPSRGFFDWNHMLLSTGLIPEFPIPALNGYLVLPRDFLQDSCLGIESSDTPLFFRESLMEQVDFIQNRVINTGMCGSIYGLPGTGKSITTYLFASFLAKSWTVVWIHMERWNCVLSEIVTIIKMSGSVKEVFWVDFDELVTFLKSPRDFFCAREILVIHGLTNNSDSSNLSSAAGFWWRKNRENRRLILIESKACSGNRNPADSKKLNIEYFEQISWSVDEYKEAVKNVDFFRIVEPFLDADLETEDDAEKRVVSKFFYAGGSARLMFQVVTEEVKRLIIGSISPFTTISDLFYGNVGTHINLMSVKRNKRRSLLSAFCAIAIASIRGPACVQELAKNVWLEGYPFISGGSLELTFCAHAASGRIQYKSKQGDTFSWTCAETVSVFKPNSPSKVSCVEGHWLKPNSWDNLGYDAVFLYERIENQKKVIRFVKITNEHGLGVQLSNFRDLIDKMRTTGVFIAEEVEVFFVVPTEMLAAYKVGKIESPDRLGEKYGWPTIEEGVRSRISIVELEFERVSDT